MSHPRFNVLFEEGHCLLRARQPFAAGSGQVESLAMTLPVFGSFDLRAGVRPLRNKRKLLRHAKLSFSFAALEDEARRRGVTLWIRSIGTGLLVEVEDDHGVLATKLSVATSASSACLCVEDLVVVRRCPVSSFDRLRAAGERLGLRFDVSRGTFVLSRPVWWALCLALGSSGWRAPDDRSAALDVSIDRRGVLLEANHTALNAAPPMPTSRAWKQLLRSPSRDPFVLPLDLTQESAWRQVSKIESERLRADGIFVLLEANVGLSRAPEQVEDAALWALSRFPRDFDKHEAVVLRWAGQGDAATEKGLSLVRSGPWPRHSRGTLIARALFEYVDAHGGELEVDDDLMELAHWASEAAPSSAHPMAATAALHAASRNFETALLCFEEAISATSDPRDKRRWRRLLAECARAVGDDNTLERVLREDDEDPLLLVSLAELHVNRGQARKAEELMSRLLEVGHSDDTYHDALTLGARLYESLGSEHLARRLRAAINGSLNNAPEEPLDPADPAVWFGDDESGPVPVAESDPGEASDSEEMAIAYPEYEHSDPTNISESNQLQDWTQSEGSELEDSSGSFHIVSVDRPSLSDDPEVSLVLSRRELPSMDTHVGNADKEVRELKTVAESSGRPVAFLRGALDGAIDEGDADAVRLVYEVLTRLDSSDELDELRRDIERWLRSNA